jgi:hypothetical protein
MYSGEYDACDVTLSVYPHLASLKNMPDHVYYQRLDNELIAETYRILTISRQR